MGSDPSKSKQLDQTFHEFRILKDLTLSQQPNIYELIYVQNNNTNEIFIIKQSNKQLPTTPAILAHENIVKRQQTRMIDVMYYTLYEHIPQSLERIIGANPMLVSRTFAIYIIQNLIRIYTFLFRETNGDGLDIRTENIRSIATSSSIVLKVYPPSLTKCPFKHRNTVYNNKISDLGEILYTYFKTKGKQIGYDIINFINLRMKNNSINGNIDSWSILQNDSMRLGSQPMISAEQLNNYKYYSTPVRDNGRDILDRDRQRQRDRDRSISPIRYQSSTISNNSNRPISPLPMPVSISNYQSQYQPPSQYSSHRPISPINGKVVVNGRDLSPQISRISIYENNSWHQSASPMTPINAVQPMSVPNVPMPVSQTRQQNNQIPYQLKNTNTNTNININKGSVSPIKYTNINKTGVDDNSRNIHQRNGLYNYHQNTSNNNQNVGINNIQAQIQPHDIDAVGNPKSVSPSISPQLSSLPSLSPSPILPSNNSQIYKTIILTPQTPQIHQFMIPSPSPVPSPSIGPSPSIVPSPSAVPSPSPQTYNKVGFNANNIQTQYKNNQNPHTNISNFNTYQPYSNPYSDARYPPTSTTPKQRNINIASNGINGQPVAMFKNQKYQSNQNIRYETDKKIVMNQRVPIYQQPQPQQTHIEAQELIKQTKSQNNQPYLPLPIKIQKQITVFPIFEPSMRDPLQIRPKQGVPNLSYTPKTKQDRHDQQNNKGQSSKSSLNLKQEQQQDNFVEKHLMVKNARNDRELLGSSIPVVVDKSSSFGLTFSQDSQNGNYQGIYQGPYHPNFPTTKHGVGKLVFPSGGTYQGNFNLNKMDGWGKLFYPSGRLAYEGYWKNSKFEGYGKLFNETPLHIDMFDYRNFYKIHENNQDGYWKYYEGSMKNDMKQGHGVWVLENGQKYDGDFHEDKVHGNGIYYSKKGNIEGIWEDNILVKIIDRQ